MKINESESSRRYPERAVVDTNVIVNVALGKDDTTDPSFLPDPNDCSTTASPGSWNCCCPRW